MPMAPHKSPDRAIRSLERLLASCGWELTPGRLRSRANGALEICLRRSDGRWIMSRQDHIGRCRTERFHRTMELGMPAGRAECVPLSPQIDDLFLGREYHQCLEDMLHFMAGYVSTNSSISVSELDIEQALIAALSSLTCQEASHA